MSSPYNYYYYYVESMRGTIRFKMLVDRAQTCEHMNHINQKESLLMMMKK